MYCLEDKDSICNRKEKSEYVPRGVKKYVKFTKTSIKSLQIEFRL